MFKLLEYSRNTNSSCLSWIVLLILLNIDFLFKSTLIECSYWPTNNFLLTNHRSTCLPVCLCQLPNSYYQFRRPIDWSPHTVVEMVLPTAHKLTCFTACPPPPSIWLINKPLETEAPAAFVEGIQFPLGHCFHLWLNHMHITSSSSMSSLTRLVMMFIRISERTCTCQQEPE